MPTVKRKRKKTVTEATGDAGASYRKPSYGAAGRYARIVYELLDRPHGWSFDAIQDELRISERTVLRYVAALKEQLQDDQGRALIEVFNRGDRRLIRFAQHRPTPEPGGFDLSLLYFALTVFRFLDGTVIKEGVDSLWDRFREKLPFKERVQLADFDKKFYATQHVVKDYTAFSDILDKVFQCVVRQYSIRLLYEAVGGEPKEHEFDPYTLLMHRGGLYLIGRSSRSPRILTLAVERIQKAEKLSEHFDYPSGYSPEKHTAGAFGIIVDEKSATVEILITDRDTVQYVGARRIHPSQKLHKHKDGTATLRLTVQGTAELRNWVLGFGPHMQIVQPPELRDEMRDQLSRALALYQAPEPASQLIEAAQGSRAPKRLAEPGVAGFERSAVSQEKVTEPPPWSESLQWQTRAAVEQLSISQDGALQVKHKVLGDAAIFAFDDSLLVVRVRDGKRWEYPEVEALLTDGWVVD